MATIRGAADLARRSRLCFAVWILLVVTTAAQGQTTRFFFTSVLHEGLIGSDSQLPMAESAISNHDYFDPLPYGMSVERRIPVVEWALMQEIPLDLPVLFGDEGNTSFNFYYGAGQGGGGDAVRMQSQGSVLGTASFISKADNIVSGPEIGLSIEQTQGRFELSLVGRAMYGYADRSVDVTGSFNADAIPGALKRPLFSRELSYSRRSQIDDFAPLGQVAAGVAYHISKRAKLRLDWTGLAVSDVLLAGDQFRFTPDPNAGRDVFTNTTMVSFTLQQ
jgi:hypothetical protein